MKLATIKRVFRGVLAASVAMRASGCWTPLQIGVIPPAQIVSERADVYGLKLNLPYAKSEKMSEMRIGLINIIKDGNNISW